MLNRVCRIFRPVLALGLVLFLLAGSAIPAYASVGTYSDIMVTHNGKLSEVKNGKTFTIYLNPRTGEKRLKNGTERYGTAFLWPAKNYFTKVSTSNKKVISVGNSYLYGWMENNEAGGTKLYIKPQKTGKAKLTYTYGGKKNTVTVVVKKWVNKPAAKIAVAGKACKPTSATGCRYTFSAGDGVLAGKSIKVTPRTGWKVKGILWEDASGKTRTIKNGKKIPSKVTSIRIVMKNAKTGGIEDVELQGTN